MRLQRLDASCPDLPVSRGETPSHGEAPTHLALVPDLVEPEPDTGPLRILGVVRTRTGESLPGARLQWWHPAPGDVVSGEGDDGSGFRADTAGRPGPDGTAGRPGPDGTAGRPGPDGTAATGERGDFDIVAADPDDHIHVVVSAPGYESISVRLVPLPGLPPITPPVTRSGRAPLPVRPGAGAVECWCEFALTPLSDD